MKKIYKRLVILFTILTIVLTGMFVISMIGLKWKQSGKRIQETLQNTKTILQESVEDYYTQEKLIKLDYLNRAEAIDFIIRNNTNMSDAFSLNEVKEALGVNEIYALDESGQIVYSTSKANEKAILEAAQSAVAALHHEEEKRYEYYAEKSEDGKTFVYAGVCLKTEGDEYATLVIDYPVENNGLRMKNEFIEKELKNLATDYNTTVMAIDVKEKELIGVTDKNKKFGKEEIQLILEKLLQVISSTEEGKVMWFVYDGTVITSVDMNYDDDIILIGIDTGFSVMDDLWMTMLRMVGFSIVIYIIVIAFFNYLIKKLIFEDIEKNKAKIQKIMSGEHDIEFETCKVEEIEELVSTIKQLNHGYIHKTERMNKMFNSISPNIATFELLDENYASFFSDNFECVRHIYGGRT